MAMHHAPTIYKLCETHITMETSPQLATHQWRITASHRVPAIRQDNRPCSHNTIAKTRDNAHAVALLTMHEASFPSPLSGYLCGLLDAQRSGHIPTNFLRLAQHIRHKKVNHTPVSLLHVYKVTTSMSSLAPPSHHQQPSPLKRLTSAQA